MSLFHEKQEASEAVLNVFAVYCKNYYYSILYYCVSLFHKKQEASEAVLNVFASQNYIMHNNGNV